MQQTRRSFLTGIGVTAGLSGCLGVDGVTYPDEPDEWNTSQKNSTSDNKSDKSGSNTDIGPHPPLTTATREIVDDVLWFATTYQDAIDGYLEATADVLEAVSSLSESIREPTDPTVAMADQLKNVGYSAAERAEDALEPHFSPADLLRSRTDRHIPVLTRSARRDDADRFLEELDRMHGSFFRIQTPIYVAKRFSRDPIHNRLLDRLVSGQIGNVLVGIAVPDRRQFTALAYSPYPDESGTHPPTFTDDTLSAARHKALRNRFGPVVQPTERTEELFFIFAKRPELASRRQNAFRGTLEDLEGVPLYVQQYPDTETAGERLNAVLDAGDTEGQEPIVPEADESDGAIEWHRYYHREAGSDRTDLNDFAGVQYGYLLQAGEFLFATGFSGDAWEERTRWQGQLTDSWVMSIRS